jgi:hypothetical protein
MTTAFLPAVVLAATAQSAHSMKTFYSFGTFAILGLALLSSCAVYVPTIPSTPLVTKKGEVEVTGGIRSLSSVEASAAWSPAPHLLLTGETALQASNGSETRNGTTTNYRNVHRQASLGLGTYRLLGQEQAIYLAAVGGLGMASANVYDPNLSPIGLFSGPLVHYEAHYLRYYGQVYVARQTPRVNYGASLRSTFVDYSRLQRDGATLASLNRVFLEPTLFVRVGRRALQWQTTVGFSAPLNPSRSHPDHANLAPSSMLIGTGVVFRPALLRHRAAE